MGNRRYFLCVMPDGGASQHLAGNHSSADVHGPFVASVFQQVHSPWFDDLRDPQAAPNSHVVTDPASLSRPIFLRVPPSVRCFSDPELALGEAYMDGTFLVERGTDRGCARARNNVAHHYDLDGRPIRCSSMPTNNIAAPYSRFPGTSLDDAQLRQRVRRKVETRGVRPAVSATCRRRARLGCP